MVIINFVFLRLQQSINIEAPMYAFNWYNSFFIDVLKFSFVVRVIDLFFIEGENILLKTALVILKYLQKELLQSTATEVLSILSQVEKHLQMNSDEFINHINELALPPKRLSKLHKEYDSHLIG